MDTTNGVLVTIGVVAMLHGLLSLKRSLGLAGILRTIHPVAGNAGAEFPAVSVLAPCRGVDSHFERYAQALLAQDYPCYEVLFLVESTADPAWDLLSRALAEVSSPRASLIVTGTAVHCSQKIHNLLVGLDQIDTHTTILAFVDSDVQVHPHWLQTLVTALACPSIGATSGFRWYVPYPGSLVTSLRSAWNAALMALMIHPRFAFAWGGSSAIRRDVFENLEIRKAWSRGLSDDLLLTQAVRAAGLRVHFVPACLVPTFEACTWRQLLEWASRQVTIGRVYAPQAWQASLLIQLMNLILGILALTALLTGRWTAGGILLSSSISHAIGSAAVCRAATHRLAAHDYTIAQAAWAQALWTPVVTVLSLLCLAVSMTTRTITWRGISYTMLAPQQVVIHRDPQPPTPFVHPS